MTEYWKSSQVNYWCDYCKCWVKDSLQGRALHENGPRHKDMVERKMREAKRQSDKEERMQSMARASMDKIEALARKQYQEDLRSQGISGSSAVGNLGTKPVSQADLDRAEAEREADLEIKRAAEQEYRAQYTGREDVQDWAFDQTSGYYYSNQLSCYYDGNSGLYYWGNPPAWKSEVPKLGQAASYEKFYSKAEQYQGAGPAEASSASLKTTVGYGQASKFTHASMSGGAQKLTQGNQSVSNHRGNAVQVIRPVQKMQERSNNAIGGYRLPLYSGTIGGAKTLGRVTKKEEAKSKVSKIQNTKIAKSSKSKMSAEDARALSAREAARKRVEKRTMNSFGFS